MNTISVDRRVDRSPAVAFEVVRDLRRYPPHSRFIEKVRRNGNGGSGTSFELDVGWWRATATATARVTECRPPFRLDWRLVSPAVAEGHWLVENHGQGSQLSFLAKYDAGSIEPGAISVPLGVSVSSVLARIDDLLEAEAARVVEGLIREINEYDP